MAVVRRAVVWIDEHGACGSFIENPQIAVARGYYLECQLCRRADMAGDIAHGHACVRSLKRYGECSLVASSNRKVAFEDHFSECGHRQPVGTRVQRGTGREL